MRRGHKTLFHTYTLSSRYILLFNIYLVFAFLLLEIDQFFLEICLLPKFDFGVEQPIAPLARAFVKLKAPCSKESEQITEILCYT